MTRPVDVDGTPLHVGDLVRGTWAPDKIGYGNAGPWEITKCHGDGCITDSGATSHDDDGYYYTPESVRRVPETRQERIVRRSHERPQVVQVRDAHGVAWAVIADGRAYGFTASGRDSALRVAWAGNVRMYGPRDDGTWTVL